MFQIRKFRIENTGSSVALHVNLEEATNLYWMEAEGNYESLFPGESRIITVRCVRKQSGGFLTLDQAPLDDLTLNPPEIIIKKFNGFVTSQEQNCSLIS
jgi:beta-mannosidase